MVIVTETLLEVWMCVQVLELRKKVVAEWDCVRRYVLRGIDRSDHKTREADSLGGFRLRLAFQYLD